MWARRIGWVLTLFFFWLLFTQSLDPQALITGVVVGCLVVAMNDDLLLSLTTDMHMTSKTAGLWLKYVYLLVIDIVKASWQVAKLAFAPTLDLQPGFSYHEAKLTEPMMRVILANSITLTPGTLTVEAPVQGKYVIHSINKDAEDGLKDWHIEQLLADIERKR